MINITDLLEKKWTIKYTTSSNISNTMKKHKVIPDSIDQFQSLLNLYGISEMIMRNHYLIINIGKSIAYFDLENLAKDIREKNLNRLLD